MHSCRVIIPCPGIKAEVDGLIIEGGEDAQDPPVLRAFHGTDFSVKVLLCRFQYPPRNLT